MRITGNDGNSRYFQRLSENRAKCLSCNTEFDFIEGYLVERAKTHICPTDPEIAALADRYLKYYSKCQNSVDSEK